MKGAGREVGDGGLNVAHQVSHPSRALSPAGVPGTWRMCVCARVRVVELTLLDSSGGVKRSPSWPGPPPCAFGQVTAP